MTDDSNNLSNPSDVQTAKKKRQAPSLLARAIGYLSRREYSEHELRERLKPYAQTPEQIEEVIQTLQTKQWQSDTRFAHQFASSRSHKWGMQKILYELRPHQIDPFELERIQDDLKETELQRAYEVWRKKFKDHPPQTPQERAKQIRFLASRGFRGDVIQKVLKLDDELFE